MTRTLFGAGEAGAFPNMTRIFTTWLPDRERERAQAMLWLASRWGGALTPLLVAYILQFMSWRRAFELFGVLGVIWAVAFYRWYRDDPGDAPVGQQRGARAAAADARDASRRQAGCRGGCSYRSLRSGCCARSTPASRYGWWFYVTWLPTYLREARGTSVKMGALLAGLPLLLGGVGCLISAALIPRIARATGSVALRPAHHRDRSASSARRRRSSCSPPIQDPVKAMLVLGMAGLFNDFVMPAAWAGCMDIGGRYAGTVSGAMNMMGSIAGALSPLVVGYLLAWTSQNWTLTFYVSAAIYSLGAICWLFLDAHTPLEAPVVGRRAA